MGSPGFHLKIKGLTAEDLGGGFSVVFWVYLETANKQYLPRVIRIHDKKKKEMTLFVSGATLFCVERTANY
jgi:hypothetical protein